MKFQEDITMTNIFDDDMSAEELAIAWGLLKKLLKRNVTYGVLHRRMNF
jgi:hypothetical protein